MPLWKRGIDIAFCLALLPVLAVLTLCMTVYTRLVAPGPVIFRQERIGYRGQRFRILKFRTMKLNTDGASHSAYFQRLVAEKLPMTKLDSHCDARLIPGCWLLRACGIDELPQIINVLRGEMTLVGPRPCIASELSLEQPSHRARLTAVPGLTGLWQVSGKNRTTFDEMIELDICYSYNVSLSLDLQIILLTPWALAMQYYEVRQHRNSTSRVASPKLIRPGLQAPATSERSKEAALDAVRPVAKLG